MEIVNNNLILFDVDVHSNKEAIEAVANILEKEGRLLNKEIYIQDVYKREEEIPTALGLDIAIPHARSEGVKTTSLVYLRLKESIQWNHETVNMVFGIAVPNSNNDCNNDYLKILSKLARKLMNEDYRKQLLNTTSKEACVELLSI